MPFASSTLGPKKNSCDVQRFVESLCHQISMKNSTAEPLPGTGRLSWTQLWYIPILLISLPVQYISLRQNLMLPQFALQTWFFEQLWGNGLLVLWSFTMIHDDLLFAIVFTNSRVVDGLCTFGLYSSIATPKKHTQSNISHATLVSHLRPPNEEHPTKRPQLVAFLHVELLVSHALLWAASRWQHIGDWSAENAAFCTEIDPAYIIMLPAFC